MLRTETSQLIMTENSENSDVVKKANETPQNKEDEELSALLDSALEDFTSATKPTDTKAVASQENKDVKRPEPPHSLWNDEFLQQTAARFEHNIQTLFSPGADGSFSAEQLGENIQRMAEAVTQAAGFDASPDTEFSSIIAQTLKNLSENAENLQNGISEEELMNLLGTFGNVTDPNSGSNGILPFMQQMMQNLLSKDVLYPALSSMVEKYPQWLEDNKSKLSAADFDRYTEQYNVMKEVCTELEKETPNDSQEVINSRFDKVLALMQKLQECGQPPAELAGDLDPLLHLDEHGNPQLPPNFSPNQCTLM